MAAPVVRPGNLLVAAVSLLDPNFQRTVVLMCEHRNDEGSYGLVLNRPLDLSADLEEKLSFARERLFVGGPVQPEVLQVLHPFGRSVPGSRRVLDGVWTGGEFEVLEAGFAAGSLDPAVCRFYLGYSGWAPKQLAGEFAANSWLLAPGSPRLVFDTPADRLWLQAVRERGREEPLYANYPENPRWN